MNQSSSFYLVIFLTVTKSSTAFAFLDSIATAAKDAAKIAVYTGAITDLTDELGAKGDSLRQGAASIDERSRRLAELQSSVDDGQTLTMEFQERDWSRARLDENLAFTARYITRAKRMLVSMGFAGVDVATAMNTAESNLQLNEIVKNQQTELLLARESNLDRLEEQLQEKREWRSFIEQERKARGGFFLQSQSSTTTELR